MNTFYYLAARINAEANGIPEIGASGVLSGALNAVYIFAGIACVIVIVISGIIYTTSQGDAAKVKRAREGIIYALVGMGVIITAFVITNFIIGRF